MIRVRNPNRFLIVTITICNVNKLNSIVRMPKTPTPMPISGGLWYILKNFSRTTQ